MEMVHPGPPCHFSKSHEAYGGGWVVLKGCIFVGRVEGVFVWKFGRVWVGCGLVFLFFFFGFEFFWGSAYCAVSGRLLCGTGWLSGVLLENGQRLLDLSP